MDTTYRPPTKWRPVKCLTNGFGAVRLTRVVGINVLPRPVFGGPCSMSQDDGASTDVTGSFVSCRAWMTAGNGSRTSPEKLNPIIRSDVRKRVASIASTHQRLRQLYDRHLSQRIRSHRQTALEDPQVALQVAKNTISVCHRTPRIPLLVYHYVSLASRQERNGKMILGASPVREAMVVLHDTGARLTRIRIDAIDTIHGNKKGKI